MDKTLETAQESVEDFYTFTKRTIFIKISYLFVAFFATISFVHIPTVIFFTVFLMVLFSLIVFIFAKKYADQPKTIVNTLFLLCLLDTLLLTVIINFLGLTMYIIYSFYIVLGFMSLPRTRGLYLLGWIVFLYLGLVALQYLQIFRPLANFSAEETSTQNLNYVAVMVSVYSVTLLFLAMRCYDFYRAIEKRIQSFQFVQLALEEEKSSLEIRIRAKVRELGEEKRKLESRVTEREKELKKENEEFEEKIEELERFKKVALGREVKAKDLEERLLKIGKIIDTKKQQH